MLEEDCSWWIDSCASRHICKERSLFKTFETMEDGYVLFMGNSTTATVKGKGTVNMEFTSGNVLTLTDVSHVPEIRKNLMSRGLLNKFGFKCVFESDQFVLTKGDIFVGKGYLFEGIFKLNLVNKVNVSAYMIDSFSLWHNRLGHVNTRKLHDMSILNLIPHSMNDMVDKCRICLKTKIVKKSFPKIDRSSTLLQLVHNNVCDMHSNPTRGGKKYFVTFIDDFSKFCYVYLLFSKDEVLENFKIYKIEVENQCDARIKCLRFDRGGEFHFPSYCESVSIIHETSIAYTPQQNGVVERKNKTLVEMVNTLLCNSRFNKSFWGEALFTTCYILNRIPQKKSKVTPYELWKKRKFNLNYFKVWGCRAIVRLHEPKIRKLGQRNIEYIFLGYAQCSKGYWFLVVEPNNYVEVNIVIESRDAEFYENRFTSTPSINDKMEEPIRNNNESGEPSESSELRSKRMRKEKSFGPYFIVYLVEGSRNSSSKQKMISPNIDSNPLTYEEAMKSQDAAFWKEVINDEMDSIMGNNMWILVDLPLGSIPIGCKWIFKRKLKVDGTVEKFKARLVAKGFDTNPVKL
jgi:hypothetical protein